MESEPHASLFRQFGSAWKLADYHLTGLTTAECLWRPAVSGLHLEPMADGRWRGVFPDKETYDLGPASIAWLTWHMGYWWEMVLDHSFGSGGLNSEVILWPGSAEATRAWLSGLKVRWCEAVGALGEAQLQSAELCRWPFRDRPFADVIAWVNLELTKNAAEVGYARFLYAARHERED